MSARIADSRWRRGVAALAGLLAAAAANAAPPDAAVRPLLTERLPDLSGQELSLVTVEYPPGGASPSHRHDAYVLVYVLTGSLVMQVAGQAPVTLKAGDTFIERPPDVHAVSRNASDTEPAKFLAFMIRPARASSGAKPGRH